MKARTKATSVNPKVRETILERDNNQCVSCGSRSNLTMAHVFVNRSHGGMGVKENLATLCIKCHHELDNGKKHEQDYQRAAVQFYMIEKYGMPELKKITYNKWNDLPF
jgi:5-methylcytosine-specific restriction endonuclease McrA